MKSTHENTPTSATDHANESDDRDASPQLRLSWSRLLGVIAIAGIAVTAGLTGFKQVAKSASESSPQQSWSVPYVDVTLTPTYEFQDPQSNPARDIALAFVVAHPDDACTPSWGGAYTMEEAARDLELDRRITQLRAAGGDIMISFGGQANEELAFACTDQDRLTDAYRDVIERYDVQVIDLDIENADLADAPSIARRAEAIATLQAERADAGDELAVWLTLPVATTGLTDDGVSLVSATLDGGVELTGVNVMTMNFSNAAHPTSDMFAATAAALEATTQQIGEIYAAQGITLDEAERWARVGATPMIGQNDVAGEIFTLDDARSLAAHAIDNGLGRVSTWSLNRDQQCPTSFSDVVVLSNTCSSVEQEPLEFANVFTSLPGRAPNAPDGDTVTIIDDQRPADDPATSPYPIWRPEAQYVTGYKTVRNGLVYQAKWYTQGFDPSTTVANAWDTPWSLVGPVQPDDIPFAPATVPSGTHPQWSPDEFYSTGDQVLLEGLAYEARWPNSEEVPSLLFPVGPDSAWKPLFTVPGEPGTP